MDLLFGSLQDSGYGPNPRQAQSACPLAPPGVPGPQWRPSARAPGQKAWAAAFPEALRGAQKSTQTEGHDKRWFLKFPVSSGQLRQIRFKEYSNVPKQPAQRSRAKWPPIVNSPEEAARMAPNVPYWFSVGLGRLPLPSMKHVCGIRAVCRSRRLQIFYDGHANSRGWRLPMMHRATAARSVVFAPPAKHSRMVTAPRELRSTWPWLAESGSSACSCTSDAWASGGPETSSHTCVSTTAP